MKQMRVILSGGGTGGHIYPAIALAQEISLRHKNAEILFIGAHRGMERELVPLAGFKLTTLEITSLPRRPSWRQLRSVLVALRAVFRARRLVSDFAPDVVVGTGGYVAGPILFAAALGGYPTLIHEQNAYPSLTNRILGRLVKGIAVSHEAACRHFPAGKVRVTGNPLRKEVLATDRERSRAALGLSPGQQLLVIVGGSSGAQAINNAVVAAYKPLLDAGLIVYHVTGKRHFESTLAAAQGFPREQLTIVDYASNMADILAAADLAVSRAGGIIAELAVLGVPSVLIPLPHAPNDHQNHNAQAVARAGAGIVLEERLLSGASLTDQVLSLLRDPIRLADMRQKSRALGFPRATEELCDLMEIIAG